MPIVMGDHLMVIITPVINLQGDCDEAIHLYEKAFETKADFILHYSDAKKEDWNRPLTKKQKNMVYHAEMKIGSQRLMFSDIIEFDLIKGNSFFLTITFETKEEVQKAYRILSEGCVTLAPMRSTTYSSCVVSFIDRFGMRWGLMTEQPGE
jgi:PhnB protein